MADQPPLITIQMLINIVMGSKSPEGPAGDFLQSVDLLTDVIYNQVHHLISQQDPSSVDDVTQEVFIRIVTMVRKWVKDSPEDLMGIGPKKLTAYIRQMARNRACDHLRKIKSRLEDLTDLLPSMADSTPLPDYLVDASLLEKPIAELPPNRQTFLRMKFGEDCTDSEIAEATKTPIGTVKSNNARSIVSLSEYADRHRRSSKGE